jgi:hypothetical protein
MAMGDKIVAGRRVWVKPELEVIGPMGEVTLGNAGQSQNDRCFPGYEGDNRVCNPDS